MSAGYVRRWTSEQSAATYLAVESVNIVDLQAPSVFAGVPFGRALLVGEFEDGPFGTPTLVTDSDLGEGKTYGGFGFTYQGVRYQNPCARSRLADGAVVPEYWNGSGFIQLQGKKFSSLVLSRVDTSVGNVSFSRVAYLNGFNKPFFALANASVLVANTGAANVTATFTGTAATVTGSAATFGSITAGMTVTLGYDAQPNFVTTFLSTDTVVANVVARINQYAGFNFATNAAGQVQLTGIQAGTGGQVRVVSGTAGTLADLGLTAANTAGTGNVQNLNAIAPSELNTVVNAASANIFVRVLQDGTIRLANEGFGPTGQLLVYSSSNAAANLGFAPLDTFVFANVGNNGIIPAGTVCSVPAGNSYVTMQTITVANNSAGPYSVKVRPAQDDDSQSTTALVSTVTQLAFPVQVDAYTITNPLPLAAALSESAIDAAYSAAFTACEDINTPAKQVNVSWAARQSNSVRRALRSDALTASASGLFGRVACLRTPMGLSKTAAMSTTTEPGVGPYSNERVLFCYPQAAIIVEAIQQRGTAGGNGFSANGQTDIGADGFLASSISQLSPGENPAQDGGFLDNIVSLESKGPTGLLMQDYINFKAAGIVALRMDAGQAIFQSGVTSVNPLTNSNQTDIERRTLADFIEDSMALLATTYIKLKMTAARKAALLDAWTNFLNPLLGDADGNNQFLNAYSLVPQNTTTSLAQGRYRVVFKGQSVPSFKSIELGAMVGPSVVIDELV
jgi:hypothetical protein